MAARDTQVGGDHYQGEVQPWDVVDTWPLEQQVGVYRHGILKYTMRMGDKDERLQEIRKAKHYAEKLIEVLEKAEEAGDEWDAVLHEEPVYPVPLTQEDWDALNEAALDMSSRAITGKEVTQELLDQMDALEQERQDQLTRVQKTWAERTQPGGEKGGPQPHCFTDYPARYEMWLYRSCDQCHWQRACQERTALAAGCNFD